MKNNKSLKILTSQFIVRNILSLFITYSIYTETGIFTALFVFFVIIQIECDLYSRRITDATIEIITDHLARKKSN